MPGWVDVHAHYLTEHYAAACRFAGHGQPDGIPGLPGWSLDAALDIMATTGVEAAILSISSPGVHFGDNSIGKDSAARGLAAEVNDAGAHIVAGRPAQFGLSVVLPLPDVDGALLELSRGYDELGADAVALKTNYHGRYLSDPEFAPVLAELDTRAAVVTLHPTSPACWEVVALGRPRPMIEFLFDTTRCVIDLALSGILAKYPAIRWIVPHAGAVLPVLAHRVAAFASLTPTTTDVLAALAGLYYDLAGMPLPVALDALLAVARTDRLLYGSDFPFTPAPMVAHLADALAKAPALADAQLGLDADSPCARLFPRLHRAQQNRSSHR